MSEIGIIVSLSLFGVAGWSLYSTFRTSKILRDIFLHQVFELNPTQNLYITQPITLSQLFARYIPHYGFFKYNHVQYDLPPACHSFLFAGFSIFLWSVNIISATITNEFSIISAVTISLISTIFSLLLTTLIRHSFMSSFNIRTKSQTMTDQAISEFPDLLLERSFNAEQRSTKSTLEKLLERSMLASFMILAVFTFWSMSTIDYQDTEIFMSAMTQFWIGFAIDVPFRILICVIVKSAKIVKNYEGKYLAFSLNIQPNELKKYSRTPIKLINENLSQENANLPNCDDLIKSNGLIESVSPLTFVEQSIVEKTFDMSSNDIKKDSPLRLPRLNKSPQLGDFLRNYDDFLMNINQANYVEEDPYLGKDLSGEEANSPYFSVNVKRKLSDEETIASHNGSSEEELILYPENFPSTPRPSRCAVFQSPSPKKNNSPDKRKATSSKGLKLKLHSCEKSKVRPDLSPMKTPENDSHSFFDSLLEIAGEYNEPEIVDYDCKLQNSCGKSDLGNTYSDYKDKTAATINIDESMPESQFNTTACIEIIDSLQLSSCKNKYNKHTDNLNHSRSKENEFSHVPEPDFAGSMSDERRVRDPVSKPPVFNRRRTSPDITSQVLEEIRPTNSSPKPPIYNQRRSSIEFGTPVSEDPRTSESSPKPPSLRGRKLRKGSDRDQLRNAGELLVSDRNSIDNPDILQRRRSKEEIGRPPRVPSPARSDSETFY